MITLRQKFCKSKSETLYYVLAMHTCDYHSLMGHNFNLTEGVCIIHVTIVNMYDVSLK